MAEERTTVDVLRAARARIEDERHWCRKVLARAGNNRPVDPTDVRARRWCVVGAIEAERDPKQSWVTSRAVDALGAIGPRPPHVINDLGGHAAVLSLLDAAIAAEEAADAAPA